MSPSQIPAILDGAPGKIPATQNSPSLALSSLLICICMEGATIIKCLSSRVGEVGLV